MQSLVRARETQFPFGDILSSLPSEIVARRARRRLVLLLGGAAYLLIVAAALPIFS